MLRVLPEEGRAGLGVGRAERQLVRAGGAHHLGGGVKRRAGVAAVSEAATYGGGGGEVGRRRVLQGPMEHALNGNKSLKSLTVK